MTFGTTLVIIIYLLTAIGLSPDGSTHLHTNNTQNNTNINRTTQITNNVEECGPCHVFASFYPGICLTTEEKTRKNHSQGKRNFSWVNKNFSQIFLFPNIATLLYFSLISNILLKSVFRAVVSSG
jgi:hypothetical protein